jgi:hypothetical protein
VLGDEKEEGRREYAGFADEFVQSEPDVETR